MLIPSRTADECDRLRVADVARQLQHPAND